MSVVRKKLGATSEGLAARYLQEKGLQIIERNFRCPAGEIDLIAKEGDRLVFVEVKSRRSLKFGHPSLAVNGRKQHKLVLLAKWYLKFKKLFPAACRFDVVSIHTPLNGKRTLRHIPNAFVARRN